MLIQRFTANTREQKRALAYDGHNRHAGAAAHDKASRWRRLRRQMSRWLHETVEVFSA